MNSHDIRKKFFDFFVKNNHTLVASSPVIPAQDPTLLFTNAGMNQFKDVFLGKESRSYTRAVSIQKCIRAGGKHNDLENVGFTRRHLTFFEMMGNFSFGDYFKKEAIRFAWDFLTKELGLPADKLYPSVYEHDQEAYSIWNTEIGIPAERITRLGAADNFWQMGETGPCGPCTEIYIDRGTASGCKQPTCTPGCSCDRFLEIWNLVFMQYNRQEDGTDVPLKQTGVDTGMGLERLTSVLQNKESVFETDLFAPLIATTEKITGITYADARPDIQAAFRVLADHIRSSSFAIADGCTPSNEGRGYVLRKIIRRAALFAQKLSNKNFFHELVAPLAESMREIYPELVTNQTMISKLIAHETERFVHNLITGKAIFEKYSKESNHISGAQAFKLYDTYGFPLELTKVLAHEHHMTVDIQGFEKEMEKQRAQSGKKVAYAPTSSLDESITTEFTGYRETETASTISALLCDDTVVESVPEGTLCWVVTAQSPFFVECGGQISDRGSIRIGIADAPLLGLKKIGGAIAAHIKAPQPLTVGDQVTGIVDKERRINTMKNHTATHLLQATLIELLGKTVHQSGSLVDPDYLRFDFTYHENLNQEQIIWVENRVNEKIRENISLNIFETTHKDALSQGVIAIFGEKYNPEKVRVIKIADFSAELCGGTHVRATGDIGCFKITEVSALSAGNRRIVAFTGPKAIELFQEDFALAKALSQELKVKPSEVIDAFKKQREQLRLAQMQVRELKKKLWGLQKPEWLRQTQEIHGVPFLYLALKDTSIDELRAIAQELSTEKPGFYFLASPGAENTLVFCLLSPAITTLSLEAITAWLRSQGFVGGGAKGTFQGSVRYMDQKTIAALQEQFNR